MEMRSLREETVAPHYRHIVAEIVGLVTRMRLNGRRLVPDLLMVHATRWITRVRTIDLKPVLPICRLLAIASLDALRGFRETVVDHESNGHPYVIEMLQLCQRESGI